MKTETAILGALRAEGLAFGLLFRQKRTGKRIA